MIQACLYRVEKNISILERLLENSIKLPSPRRTSAANTATLFDSVRGNASKAHTALSYVWNCTCSSHTGCLRLGHLPSPNVMVCDQEGFAIPGECFEVAFAMDAVKNQCSKLWDETSIQALGAGSLVSQPGQRTVPPMIPHRHRITGLCSTLSSTMIDDLGVIADEGNNAQAVIRRTFKKERKWLVTLADVILWSTMSNQDGLPANEQLTRIQRYELASVMASSALQQCQTPWLGRFSTHNVYFWARHGANNESPVQIGFSRPLIAHNDWQSAVSSTESYPSSHAREVLFQLAVVLLELCFGQLLHKQPFYVDYCGPNKMPHDQTDRSAANRWCDNVMGEAGPQFFEAVRRCLDCNFGLQIQTLATSVFCNWSTTMLLCH